MPEKLRIKMTMKKKTSSPEQPITCLASDDLYCPEGHETRLSPEAQRLADAIEAVLRLSRVPVSTEAVS